MGWIKATVLFLGLGVWASSYGFDYKHHFTELEVNLHTELLFAPTDFQIQFALPVAPDMEIDPATLVIMNSGQALPTDIHVLAYWPLRFGVKRIRSLLFSTQLTANSDIPKSLMIKGTIDNKVAQEYTHFKPDKLPPDVRKYWWPVATSEEYKNPGKLFEPIVYVTLPAIWLSSSLLKTLAKPINSDPEFAWFDEAAIQFGRTAVNDVVGRTEKRLNIEKANIWMFDRIANLYNLYIRTGDVKWLRYAHQSAQYYQQHLSPKGYFTLSKHGDLKMSFSQGLWLDYLLTGDKQNLSVINQIVGAAKKWRPRYSPMLSFFTERHHSYAFWGLLTAWEADPYDVEKQQQVEQFFTETYLGIIDPPKDWEAIGCYLHEERDHEDSGSAEAVCSPWMSALLVEVIWKYYLLSHDSRSLKALSGFGDFIVRYATYSGKKEVVSQAGKVSPWYLVGPNFKYTDSGPYNDIQHSCDVSGILARSIWAKRKLGEDESDDVKMFKRYQTSCKDNLLARTKGHMFKKAKDPVWSLSPPRKYNWIFGATHDLSWLVDPASVAEY